MRIGICDDEKIYREAVKAECLNYFSAQPIIVEMFSSGVELLKAKKEFDVLFLDIEMPDEDGITVKNTLQRNGSTTRIIFLTSHEAFGKNVIDFLSKPLNTQKFQNAMKEILRDMTGKIIEVEENNKFTTIPVKTIKYIEAQDKYTLVVTNTEELLFRKPIKDWEKMLEGEWFCRISKSFLINLELYKWNADEILIDDKRINVGRKYKDIVAEQYKEFLRKKAEAL